MAAGWNYNGGGTLTVTITGATDGDKYLLIIYDNAGSTSSPVVASGGIAVCTTIDIADPAGFFFGAVVYHGSPSTVNSDSPTEAANVFKVGTASTTGEATSTTWSYNGSTGFTATFVARAGVTYYLSATPNTGIQSTSGGPFTAGSTQVMNLTTGAPSPGTKVFWASLENGIDSQVYDMRVFVGGTSGTGTAGNPSGGGGGTPPVGVVTNAGIRFKIQFTGIGGGAVVALTPVDNSLTWTYRLANVNGPAEISCDFALTETDDGTPSGVPMITPDCFAPYAYDFKLLMYVDLIDPVTLLDGIVTGVNLQSETGRVSFTGLDYSHYLEQPYPFDYSQTASQWLAISDSTKYWYAQTQQTVVGNLVSALASSGYDTLHPTITPAYLGSTWSNTINYRIPWGDSTTILAHLQAISKLYAPRGFDFWMDVGGTLFLQGPRVLDPDSVTPALTLTDASTIISVNWTNSGPNATETIAFSSGTGNGRGWYRDTYAPSVRTYRRWKRTLSIANPSASITSTSDVVAPLASAAGFLDRFPHKELKLRVNPDSLFSTNQAAGYYSMLGEAINVNLTGFAPYHHINANFYITGQTYTFDAAGNSVLDFELDQIYGTINTPPIQ